MSGTPFEEFIGQGTGSDVVSVTIQLPYPIRWIRQTFILTRLRRKTAKRRKAIAKRRARYQAKKRFLTRYGFADDGGVWPACGRRK